MLSDRQRPCYNLHSSQVGRLRPTLLLPASARRRQAGGLQTIYRSDVPYNQCQDKKNRCPSLNFPPCLRQIGSTYRKYAIAALPSAGRKILPKEWRVSFSLHRRASPWRKILLIFPTRYSLSRLAVHKVQRRRLVISRTKNYSSSSDRICSINRS